MKQYEQLVWTPEMVKNYWDYLSQTPEDYFTYQHGAEVVRQLTPFLDRDGELLDFGCGPGFLLEELVNAGFRAAGLDSSGETRQAVTDRLQHRREFTGVYDLQGLREAHRRFDTITSIEVIEHLYDEQLEEILDVMKTLLKPGGRLILTTPNEENLADSYMLCPVSNRLYHRWQHVRSWSADTLTAYLKQHGFDVVSCFTTNFSNGPKSKRGAGAWKYRLRAAKRRIKQWYKPARKQPHLVAVARVRQDHGQ